MARSALSPATSSQSASGLRCMLGRGSPRGSDVDEYSDPVSAKLDRLLFVLHNIHHLCSTSPAENRDDEIWSWAKAGIADRTEIGRPVPGPDETGFARIDDDDQRLW